MYQPVVLPHFTRQLKRHTKKYRHLKEAVIGFLDNFDKRQGAHLGKNVYKLRLQTKDIPRGKSTSFRIIVFVVEFEKYVVPIAIYFKGDQEDITKKEINTHLEVIIWELRMFKARR
jgi:hypothetical protein